MENDVSKLRGLVINSETTEQILKAMKTVFDEWYSKIFPDLEHRAKWGHFNAVFQLLRTDSKVNKVLNYIAHVDNK